MARASLESIEQRMDELKKQKRRLLNVERRKERKLETRVKVVVGAMVLKRLLSVEKESRLVSWFDGLVAEMNERDSATVREWLSKKREDN